MWFLAALVHAAPPVVTALRASQEHSCSQSWQTTSWVGTLTLDATSLRADGTRSTVSGSQDDAYPTRAPVDHRTEVLACVWAPKDGAWQTVQGSYECRGTFTMTCTEDADRRTCHLGGSVPPLLALLADAETLVLGDGLELVADDYGWGAARREVRVVAPR